MSPEIAARRDEVRQLLRAIPFRPFRVHLTDGRTFDIPHAHWNTASHGVFAIGISAPGDNPEYPEFWEEVDWEQLDRVELREAPPRRTMSPEVAARMEEARRLLRQRPFRPFRVTLDDGQSFEVRYPEMNMVNSLFFVLGIPETGVADPFPERLEHIEWPTIRTFELLPEAAAVG